MEIKTKYSIGDFVYLITDEDQKKRIITGIIIRPSGVIYYVSCGDAETTHYDIEITKDKIYIF
jgi:hypothetical protein